MKTLKILFITFIFFFTIHNIIPMKSEINLEKEFYQACEKNNIEKIQELINSGFNIEFDGNKELRLHLYTYLNRLDLIKIILKFNKNNINTKVQNIMPWEKLIIGETALHMAARNNNLDIAKLLIENGADVNIQAVDGFTPLHNACKKQAVDVIELLLKNNADINAKDFDGFTPLNIACRKNKHVAAYLLIKNGANVNLPDNYGDTPILIAASNSYEMFKILLPISDLNMKSTNGKNLIINLVENESYNEEHKRKAICNARNAGAKIEIRNPNWNSVDSNKHKKILNYIKSIIKSQNHNLVEEIISNNKIEFIKQLKELGSINYKNKNKDNFLHIAVKTKKIDFIKLIWSIKPALIAQKNNDGKTPFDLLKESGLLFSHIIPDFLKYEKDQWDLTARIWNLFQHKNLEDKGIYKLIKSLVRK